MKKCSVLFLTYPGYAFASLLILLMFLLAAVGRMNFKSSSSLNELSIQNGVQIMPYEKALGELNAAEEQGIDAEPSAVDAVVIAQLNGEPLYLPGCRASEFIVLEVLQGSRQLLQDTIKVYEPLRFIPENGRFVSTVPGYVPMLPNKKYILVLSKKTPPQGISYPEEEPSSYLLYGLEKAQCAFSKFAVGDDQLCLADEVKDYAWNDLSNYDFVSGEAEGFEKYLSKKKELLKVKAGSD